MEKKKIAVIGAKGFAARELITILLHHPDVDLLSLYDKLDKNEALVSNFPELRGLTDIAIQPIDPSNMNIDADVVFLALPHKVSQEYAPSCYNAGKIVIDLSADFRFENIDLYEKTYAISHQAKDLNRKSVYGLPELYRDKIKTSRMIGSAGCYPTSVILPCAPLMSTDWIDFNSIIADSKSGVSGAGRNPSPITHYVSCNESIRAYSIAGHRHTPEIEEKLSLRAGKNIRIQFTPHLTPMDRGILSTIYVNLTSEKEEVDIRKLYEEFYRAEPFVRILPENQFPATKHVSFTNFCDIGIKLDKRTNRLILVSAIDNLVKGASGQAVQCMNIILGVNETNGL
ncbi:N-acetyl-gamma-glutamyl-phosphate reductase [Candidatus Sumerlaeota bacterium]|nr:N-acetyl-gamma-glutamyl-phosphate reductase [Candidatus Sumerlaeota bacterium]